MKVHTGKKGKPASVENVEEFAAPLAEIDEADAEVDAATRAFAAAPTQRAVVRLLDAQMIVASLRSSLARKARDDTTASRETLLLVKLAASRDAAVARLWGDELDTLHQQVMRVGGLSADLAAEIAADLDAQAVEESDPPEQP